MQVTRRRRVGGLGKRGAGKKKDKGARDLLEATPAQ